MHGRDLWQHLGNPKRMATPLIVAVGQVGQHTGGRGIKKLAARRHVEPRPRCTVFGPKFSGRRFAVRSSLAGRLSRKNGKTNPSQPLPVPLPHRSAKVEDSGSLPSRQHRQHHSATATARWNITFTDHLDRRVHEVQQCMRRIVEHMVCYLVNDLLPFREIKLEFTFRRNAQSAPFYSTCRSSKYSFSGASG